MPRWSVSVGDPLMVHLVALLAASGEPVGAEQGSPGQIRPVVLRAFLDQEADRWSRQVDADAVVLRRCVATASVSSPAGEATGAEMLVAVSDLSGSDEGRRRALARWLHTLNPGADYWNPLRPDPLADQLLADLDVLPQLALDVGERAIRLGDWPTLDRLLAELTRAAAAADHWAGAAIDLLLRERLDDLFDAALVELNGPLPQRLTAALHQNPVPNVVAEAGLADRLPHSSVALADLAYVITDQTVDHYRELVAAHPDAFTFLRDLALALNDQSAALAPLGRHEEALIPIEEAVRHFRELVAARPEALPQLASALNNQSNTLAHVCRREEALTAAKEAVKHYRKLATANPDDFLPGLAMSLNTQSNRLADLGRREEALTAIEEAVAIRQKLAAANPDAFLPDLAIALNNQSIALADLGRHEEALTATEEAVKHYRQLAAARPDAFLANLAIALSTQSNRLADLGRREEALTATEEAVKHYRELAAGRPAAFLANLAIALNTQSNRLADLGRHEEALTAAEEAVAIRQKLAADN